MEPKFLKFISGDKTYLEQEPFKKISKKKQLMAFKHKGFALLDVISPCVTFNNHKNSTKSYDYIREHNNSVSSATDFVPIENTITVNYKGGKTHNVKLHDGSVLSLQKTSKNYNPENKNEVINKLQQSDQDGKILTGLLYIDPKSKDLNQTLNIIEKPLNQLDEADLCPGNSELIKINSSFK